LKDLGYRFPEFRCRPGNPAIEHLSELTGTACAPATERAARRARAAVKVAHELEIIGRLDLAGYFLIVWTSSSSAAGNDVLVQVARLGRQQRRLLRPRITAVDPVKMELLFERFLSEARGEWPDIDLDLPSGERREKIIQYVYRHYGRLGAAMTANVITYRGRSAAARWPRSWTPARAPGAAVPSSRQLGLSGSE